eukprot:gene19014-22632_t
MLRTKELLDMLHLISNLSAGFRADLSSAVQYKTFQARFNLLDIGGMTKFALYLLKGYIKSTAADLNGRLTVVRLYQPGHIVADLHSFFQPVASKLSISTLSPCQALLLYRKDYLRLEQYPETHKLASHFMLLEKEIDFNKNLWMTLSAAQKVEQFFKHYPAGQLPNKDCASFLQMTEASYCIHKARYNSKY